MILKNGTFVRITHSQLVGTIRGHVYWSEPRTDGLNGRDEVREGYVVELTEGKYLGDGKDFVRMLLVHKDNLRAIPLPAMAAASA